MLLFGKSQTLNRNWPNFYIVGAPKCGTTTLYDYLSEHPRVFFPKMKEPVFFLSKAPGRREAARSERFCVGNPGKYLSLYREASGYDAVGDASPMYLWDKGSPELIRQAAPKAKIIAILRDPVARAYSQFLVRRGLGVEPRSNFFEALQADLKEMEDNDRGFFGQRLYSDMGLYCEQLRRYFGVFGRENVLVLELAELSRSPDTEMAKVTAHLGIAPLTSFNKSVAGASNVYKMPKGKLQAPFRLARRVVSPEIRDKYLPASVNDWLRNSPLLYARDKPPMDLPSRLLLQEIFAPDVVKVEELLGRKLPGLRRSWVDQVASDPALGSRQSESVGA